MIEKLKTSLLSNEVNENYIYLLQKINSFSGFFIYQKKLLFMINNFDERKNQEIITDYLTMRTKVPIEAVTNDPSFVRGEYNMLFYNGDIDNKVELFVDLCKTYLNNHHLMSFSTFFRTMYSFFQESQEKLRTDIVGLYGELYFIRYMHEHNINLMKNWLTNGRYSKYDFVIDDINIEVKTTEKELPIFRIKHRQVFNDQCVIITTINIEKNNNGISLEDLHNFFKRNNEFNQNLTFMMLLENEIFNYKINDDLYKAKYNVTKMTLYDNSELTSFDFIPENITNLTYDYNFNNEKNVGLIPFLKIIKKEN